jgi:transketolase
VRRLFSEIIRELHQNDSNVVLLLGDISVGLFVGDDESLPDYVFNVGILEQSMISMAAGMSKAGFLTFAHTISCFLVERAYEQIKLDLIYNKNKVILVSANGPFDYNKLGPTHHSPSDIPLLHTLGVKTFTPGRLSDVRESFLKAITFEGSSYIRLTSRATDYEITPGEILKKSSSGGKLQIFVGEALVKLKCIAHQYPDSDLLYVFTDSQIDNNNLEMYSDVTIWEPYSMPLIQSIYRDKFRHVNTLKCMHYPKLIEGGIFDDPHFIEG